MIPSFMLNQLQDHNFCIFLFSEFDSRFVKHTSTSEIKWKIRYISN
jgi:hypothetical protein